MSTLDEEARFRKEMAVEILAKEAWLYSTKSKDRMIWKNLGLALAATPMVGFAFLIIVILMQALGGGVTNLERTGRWWIVVTTVFIVAYIASLIYLLYRSSSSQDRERERRLDERKKTVDTLILYWQEQLAKRNKPQPSDGEIEIVRNMFLQRLIGWALSYPKSSPVWAKYFPNENYPEYPFDIVDNFIDCWGNKDFREHEKDYFMDTIDVSTKAIQNGIYIGTYSD